MYNHPYTAASAARPVSVRDYKRRIGYKTKSKRLLSRNLFVLMKQTGPQIYRGRIRSMHTEYDLFCPVFLSSLCRKPSFWMDAGFRTHKTLACNFFLSFCFSLVVVNGEGGNKWRIARLSLGGHFSFTVFICRAVLGVVHYKIYHRRTN